MSRYASPTSKRYLWHLQQVRRRKRARREPDIDADAAAYIAAVEAEDGEALEPAIVAAYDQFVRGCKADGIFDAIKASCIMAGARTLSGALVPLAGPAPTNFNFVPGDYDRVTGLKGDGSTKFLDSNFEHSTLDSSNAHFSVFFDDLVFSPTIREVIGLRFGSSDGATQLLIENSGPGLFARIMGSGFTDLRIDNGQNGIYAASIDGTTIKSRNAGQEVTNTHTPSASPDAGSVFVFASNVDGSFDSPTRSRLSFYSIGEALDLEALDARLTALMTAIDEALS